MVERGQKRKDKEGNGEQEVWEQAEEEAEEETEDNEHEEDSQEEANTIQVREKRMGEGRRSGEKLRNLEVCNTVHNVGHT